MREIEFRGKREKDGKWLYGDLNYGGPKNNHKKFASIHIWEDGLKVGYVVKQETIGQYTGLKDKNEKKIFDGDIVKIYNKGIYVVKYDYNKFGLSVVDKSKPYGWVDLITYNLEIIGNIYDNPKLYEEEL